jgi:Tol biopolymer transport system component
MSTERTIERLVADALQQSAPSSAPESLVADVLGSARGVRRRPRWLALVTERPMTRPRAVLVGSPVARSTAVLLALLLAALAGSAALVAGGVLPRPDLAVVIPDRTATPTPADIQAPTTTPATDTAPTTEKALVAYTVTEQVTPAEGCRSVAGILCRTETVWLANADGGGPHLLFPDHPERVGFARGWSADGSKLLYEERYGRLIVTDATGTDLQVIDPDVICPIPGKNDPVDPKACTGGDNFVLSPDGTRVAFVQTYANARDANVVAILDLASGTVTELSATRATNGSDRCWESTTCEGYDDTPRWSPDGRRLVFARQVASPEPGTSWTSGAVYTIDADGSGMRRLTPEGLVAFDPSWSPDGQTIVFTGVQMIVNAARTSVTDMRDDIYTIGSDGTGLNRLTNDGASAVPGWTSTGRIAFVKADWNWAMDADGGNASRLDFDLASLTAAGCVACRYPGPDQGWNDAWWQPVPGD